jgi:membrane protease YdiL (CAAX protease family)
MQTISCVVGWTIACAWFDTNTKGKGGPGSTINVARMVFFAGENDDDDAFKGSAVDVFTDACFGALVTGVVYFGPLMSLLIRYAREEESTVDAFQYLFGHHNENKERFGALVPIRDVLLAPFFEEFIFRGVLLTVLLGRRHGTREDDGVSIAAAIYISPLLFGLAHINHYFGLRKVYGHAKALQSVAFQFIYTTLFGVLAGTAFYRCKAGLAGAWSLHASMNAFGVPDFRPFRTPLGLVNGIERLCYVAGVVGAYAFVKSRIVV